MRGSTPGLVGGRRGARAECLLTAAAVTAAVVAAAVVTACGSASPARQAPRPGIVELAGTWQLHVEGEATPDAWREVTLPAAEDALDLPPGGGTIQLRRELRLGEDWRRRLAPSGLAVLIGGSTFGGCQASAGGAAIGSWVRSAPRALHPIEWVFEVPAPAVDAAGRLRLTLRCEPYGWLIARALGRRGAIGDGWLLGDLERLEMEAELRRLENLDRELPLMILVVLYAALGAYHLQLFRRDTRCREYLWFGLTSIVFAGHTVLSGFWWSTISAGTPVLQRLYLATEGVLVATSIEFLWPFLSLPVGRWGRGYQLASLALAASVVALPDVLWRPPVAWLCGAWGLPLLVAAAWVLARELRHGNAEARTIAASGLVIIAVGLVVVVLRLLGKGGVFPLLAYAFAVFALSMAFSLSNRFSRVHDDLDLLRLQLEDMVEDRAAELSSANQRLRSEIAERELAQEAMRMMERAVEQSIDGILVADLGEKTLYVNEAWARLHGRESFEVLGHGLDVFHTAEQMKRLRRALEQVRRQASWEGEIGHLKRGGTTFPAWMSVTLLRDPAVEPVGFVVVARDISERRRAEAERRRIEARVQEGEKLRSLADLAGGIAHDYNNMLTGVLGNSSLALRELPRGSPASDKLGQIGEAAERAAELTAQLLAYAGAEAPVLKRTDLDQWVREARAELARTAGESARLEIELAGDLPEIEIDAAQIRHATLTLIVHAAASTSAAGGGTITLSTGKIAADREYLAGAYPIEGPLPGDYVFLRITDSGGGIDADDGRIFDPLASPDGPVKGLGLASVLAIARVHRGTVKVRSRPQGGTAFELLFPVAGEKTARERAARLPRRRWRGSGTVLVVDDEYIMREVSRSILEQTGFEVIATGDGLEAVDLYRRHMGEIRLVLLDRTMPAMGGEEVLERIRSLDADARIVLMSGYRSDATVKELTGKGLAEFLPKPFRPDELVEKVRRLIG